MAEETLIETEESEDVVETIDPPVIDSKYRMIILAAQRSKQLQRGANSRTDVDIRKTKPTRVALKEISERRINFTFTDQNDAPTQGDS
ncbi:MAG TPA: DNA-directed RNA polymerase subunit omega [Pyrinomonadaceae bacterium]|nr:DNA-directed RNA polymerase subunit omega [Chloracidobacterium sp.]MBP9936836.1 DNA-directed RNA polymerase subunit omega [Pyrinomonadaceae bacterium]MBK9439245.1 DNA-directed RNA polymerase subunit omega [Chloracidobacterium sp.]MBK9767060.1 DNA-directed RNA polymerase subunit omega [Chloracidobacterium sp.]MBL0239463.1 DNA-directed RNA polymerase subunit omega [Chloracidobacterium sp.]